MNFGVSDVILGSFWGHLGVILEPLGVILKPLEASLAPAGSQEDTGTKYLNSSRPILTLLGARKLPKMSTQRGPN